jgi:hypothetical protein
MAKQPKHELVVVSPGFDYSRLEGPVAERVQSAADRIREKVKRTLLNIIEVGEDLLSVKEALPHGEFGKWLKAEFGWGERMAQNFMSVAERFGKSEIIADLKIAPAAGYLLAAPSVPDEARGLALDRAEAGEQITTAVAKRIVADARKARPRRRKTLPSDQLGLRLAKVLERYRARWDQKEISDLARQLQEFADQLEGPGGGRKRGEESADCFHGVG